MYKYQPFSGKADFVDIIASSNMPSSSGFAGKI
jgi:hypothetical protein